MGTQTESQVDRITRLQKEVQDKRVSHATLQARKDELQSRLDQIRKECKETLGLEPEKLGEEVERLTGIIDSKLKQVQLVLSGVNQ